MAFSQRLELRQGQSLVMTPQLQQAIKLLQLSNIELTEYCEQELEKNPLLERDESGGLAPDGDAPGEMPGGAVADSGGSDGTAGEGAMSAEPLESALAREDFSNTEAIDAAREDLYEPPDTGEPAAAEPSYEGMPSEGMAATADWGKGGRPSGEEDFIEATVSEAGTLKDHLIEQLTIAGLDGARRLIAVSLIDAVDEAGYLRLDPAELALRLDAPLAQVLAVLTIVQGFDPAGVAARDLAECLALQLKEQNRFDPAIEALLTRLDLVARRDIAQLCEICGVDAAD
ncbi:MAG: hypothetical protein WCD42_02935, partial [Rhizomicrobium sp.]